MNQTVKRGNWIGSPVDKRLYTVPQAAEYLGRTVWGIRGLIYKGLLPVIQEGRRQYVDLYDMDRFIEVNRRNLSHGG